MALQIQIEDNLIAAIKSGDNLRRDTLRLIKSSLKNAQIELGTDLSDAQVTVILQKEVKKRRESIDIYTKTGKTDLATAEQTELDIIARYLPKQMTDEELALIIKQYLETHPIELKQMGQAMKDLAEIIQGQAEMSKVSQLLRSAIDG